MAKVKLERIEEAANNLIMNSRISLLQESEGIDEKTRAKSELVIHESVRYIKGQLIQGGILEEAQNVLADVWVQAILEDIDLSSIGELGNKFVSGVQNVLPQQAVPTAPVEIVTPTVAPTVGGVAAGLAAGGAAAYAVPKLLGKVRRRAN